MLLLPDTLTLAEACDTLRLLELSLEREAEPLLVIDATPLKRFDTSALAVLLEVRRLADTWGKRLELRGLPPSLRALAALYGIDGLIESAPAPEPQPA